MAKQIIILEVYRDNGSGYNKVNYLFWFPVPANRRIPIAGYATQFRGATAQEITDLQSGAVLEQCRQANFLSNATTTEVQNELITQYQTEQSRLAALPNPVQWYGRNWDGTSWAAS